MKRLFETVAAAALFCAGGACGWLMRGAEGGRKVFRMQACQDYQGGGQYGKLKYYAVGGGNYWVE